MSQTKTGENDKNESKERRTNDEVLEMIENKRFLMDISNKNNLRRKNIRPNRQKMAKKDTHSVSKR